jgi:hypothetical protein
MGGVKPMKVYPRYFAKIPTFSQMVHARSSYKPQEVIWHAKFEDIYQYLPDQGPISIDVSRIHNVVRLEPASAGVKP